MHFPRITIFILIAALLLEPFAPAMIQAVSAADTGFGESDLSFSSLPPFPEDKEAAVIDWATMDWATPITLPTDANEYRQKLAELEKQGQFDEMGKLKPRQRLMSDQDVLAHYGAPQAVQDLVQVYLAVKPNIKTDAGRTYMRYLLAQNIRDELESADYYPADFKRQPIKYKEEAEEELPKIDLRTIKTSTFRETRPLKDEKIKIRLPAGLNPVNAGIEVFRQPLTPPVKAKPKKVSFLPWLRSLVIDEALAYYQPTVPLITYFDGIEKQPIPSWLYHLAQTQNEDGSWGDYNRYQNTAEIALALSSMRLLDNDQYALAIAYLTNTAAQNNREIAIKARLYADLSLPNQSLTALSAMAYNSDGGFGLRPGDASDIETTLEILAAYSHATLTMPESAVAYVLGKIEANGQMRYAPDGPVSFHLMNQTSRTLYWVINNTAVESKRQLIVSELARQFGVEADLSAFDEIDILQTLRTLTLYANYPAERDQLWAEAMARSLASSYFGSDLPVALAAIKALPQPDLAIISMRALGSTVNGQAVSVELTVKNKGYARASGATLAVFADNYQVQDAIIFSPAQLTLDPGGQKLVVIDFPAVLVKRFLGDMGLKFYLENSGDSSYANNWLAASYNFTAAPDGSPALPLNYGVIKMASGNLPAIQMFWPPRPDANLVTNMFLYREQGSPAWSTFPIPTLWNFVISGFDEDTVYEVTAGVLGHDGAINYFPDTTLITTSSDAAKYSGSYSGQVTIDNQPAAHFDVPFCSLGTTDSAGNFACPAAPHGVITPFAGIDRSTYPYERLRVPVKVKIGEATSGVRLYTRLLPDAEAPVMNFMELRGASDGTVLHGQTVTLVAQSSDNIGPAEADYYYYDPFEAVWLYIGTDLTNESVSSWFDWTVPALTPGLGYRVGARMRDAAGNESNWLEWGPSFTISDGIDRDAPVVTDFQILFEMDKSFNNQRTVTVYAAGTDNMGIVDGVFEYWDPNQAQWLALATAALTNASITYEWAVPAGILGSGYKLRVKLRDEAGNESAWAEWGPFTVISGAKPSGTVQVEGLVDNKWLLGETKNITWSLSGANPIASIQTIWIYISPTSANHAGSNIDPASGGKNYTMPLVAGYATNSAYAQLNVCDTAYNCAQIKSEPFSIVDPSPPPAAPWGVPQVVDGIASVSGIDRYIQQVFSNADGSTEIVYTEFDGQYYTDPGQYRRIVYRKLVNGIWQTPIVLKQYLYRDGISLETVIDSRIQAVKGVNGDIHVAYTAYTSTNNWAVDYDGRQVYYLHLANGAVVSDRNISGGAVKQMAVNDQNRVFITWTAGYSYATSSGVSTLRYIEGDGASSWISPVALTSQPTGNSALVLDQGAPVVVYRDSTQYNIIKKSGGNWSAPVAINITTNDTREFNLFSRGHNIYELFYMQSSADLNWRWGIGLTSFYLDETSHTTSILQNRDVVPSIDAEDVRVYRILSEASGQYHILYNKMIFSNYRNYSGYMFFDANGPHFNARVSPLLASIDESVLFGSVRNNVVTEYFSYYTSVGTRLQFNRADLSSAIAALPAAPPPPPGATPAANTAIQLSNYSPGQFANESIKFVPTATRAAPGSLTINWPSGFSLSSVAPNTDITVTGGGVTWAPVLNNNLNALARALTLNWTSGSLTPGSAVSIDINLVKNPSTDGQYNISVASGDDIQVLPVSIDNGLISVSAFVPYPLSNPTITNVAPVEAIIISSGATQVISFSLADVNNDSVSYTVTPSAGSISVNPNPPSPLANTQDGQTISFTYFANGAAGAQTITVTADDNEATGGGVVTYQIQLFII